MVEVNWTEAAIGDLKDIRDHIAKDSVRYADELSARLREHTRVLQEHPRIGKPVPELKNDLVREVIIGKYRIIYWVMTESELEVVAVHHAKRELHGKMLRKRISRSRHRS